MRNHFCSVIHEMARKLPRFPMCALPEFLPSDGVYFVFEKGEQAHDGDRIVRIGSHTGKGNLSARLREHCTPNKDRSIFRKNIGRALLSKDGDAFLTIWNYDQTSPKKRVYLSATESEYQSIVEQRVSAHIQENLTVAFMGVANCEEACDLEKHFIKTVSSCNLCDSSSHWFGRYSPIRKIRESGLWQSQHVGSKC